VACLTKVFDEADELKRRLAALGWQGWVRSSGGFFLYGSMKPIPDVE
jgi:hypothetical protein